MKQKLRVIVGAAAAILMGGAVAGATTLDTGCYSTTYPSGCTTSSPYWTSASFISAGSAIELNFNPITSTEPKSVTLNPLSGNTSLPFVFTSSSASFNEVTSPSKGLAAPSIALTMPSGGENALWLGLGNTGGSGGSLTLTLSDGETFSTPSSGGFGLSLSQPITSLTLSASSGQAFIDDFFFATSALPQGNPSSAPEAATILLVSGGALILFGTRRRWVRREA
jgi:hypothetical protein